ncbi:DUF2339 domain-containing protein [Jannaschia aquimarina]|uniref:DUF2339 domain-containing protein n=1 Tax=Jannaschia aquimarina TaxID=935700 RepID=A0A0D1ED34_9RHOB|nr:DUF2339 domain-containing protein [Jannaschia aquimarina]KIT14821.1 hypothetical protein jaqu_31460 [Jannaschia aquimarina]SNS56896.1 Uncharacterized membrane protein [Jannaschia aquimarina]
MEVLLGIVAFAFIVGFPVAVIVLMVQVARQRRRLTDLEARVAALAPIPQSASRPVRSPDPAPTIAEAEVDEAAETPAGPWRAASQEPDRVIRSEPASEPAPEATASRQMDSAPQVEACTTAPQGPGLWQRLTDWLSRNWFLAAAAASLGLAGIFLVQYGAERGVFPPVVRVLSALAFGTALVIVGEVVRRRYGDGTEEGATLTASIPSVLSGAGLVTAYAAILGAIHLYGLIGPGPGLAGIVAVSLLSVLLGWFHGPVLVATGLLGGALSPFVFGGASDDLSLLHGYYAALTMIGLGVDAVRRWSGRWVSWLALAVGLGGTALIHAADPDAAPAYAIALGVIVLLALCFPDGRIVPAHRGRMVLEWTARRQRMRRPGPPVLMAFVAVAVASGASFWLADRMLMLGAGLAFVLYLMVALYGREARALQDMALLPVAALIAMVTHMRVPVVLPPADPAMPLQGWAPGTGQMAALLALAALVSAAAFRRSLDRFPTWPLPWAIGAVVTLPAMGLALHLEADAPRVMGAFTWALIAMGAAAAATAMALLWARAPAFPDRREDRLRVALAGLMALALIGYGLGWLVGETALTISVAGLAFGSAWIARRQDLPEMGWFVILSAPFIGWRLTVDPGVFWHLDGPLIEVLVSMFGVAILFGLARQQLAGGRPKTSAAFDVAETSALAFLGYAVGMSLLRVLREVDSDGGHASLGILATVLLLFAAAQIELLRRGAGLRFLRIAMAGAFALAGFAMLVFGLTVSSPLTSRFALVAGPPILNTLLPAYLLPGLLLIGAGRRFGWRILTGAGAVLAGFWAILTLRHAIRGSAAMEIGSGISSAEMVVYTAALIVLGAVLFWYGLARQSPGLRRAGSVAIGLTIAKVFLIDAAALGGLFRVFAFLALGVALIGLTWLDRWATARLGPRGDDPG